MDRQARGRKLEAVYRRISDWLRLGAGAQSPSEMNIANAALREIEELTLRVDKQDYIFSRDNMNRLNQLWKQYSKG